MRKKTRYENYRVVIQPRRLGQLGSASVPDLWMADNEEDRQKQYRERCETIAEEVRRHVNGVGFVSIEFDTVSTCSHCGYAWTEDSSEFNGGCCDEDMKHAPNEVAK